MKFTKKDQHSFIGAVNMALPIIRKNMGGHLPDNPEVKDDKTLVTKIDREVEEALMLVFQRAFPNVKIVGEEGTEIGEGETVLLLDPLDGTRAFSNGQASSTIIVGIYDSAKKQTVGCVVGEAATGRIWSAFDDEPTMLNGHRAVTVWPGKFDEQATIFLDVPHGFTRKGRQILTHEQMAKLFYELRGKKLAIPGSNGLIQALVANGGQKVVGSITTAIGGPWDVCGVKLVLNAGGSARAFSVVEWNGDIFVPLILEERNPLDVMSYDILICGNHQETVNLLASCLPLPGIK